MGFNWWRRDEHWSESKVWRHISKSNGHGREVKLQTLGDRLFNYKDYGGLGGSAAEKTAGGARG
jgi:hypothetical protein